MNVPVCNVAIERGWGITLGTNASEVIVTESNAPTTLTASMSGWRVRP